ncbi:BRO-N domain-containing protein [Caulobacter sp. DWR3-1-2]|uniref:BRO-N domain-containing protein n=1 Tax=Caulobacter sp. DWR3-1-2 TaxID=2804647 RepID=UPI003CF98967
MPSPFRTGGLAPRPDLIAGVVLPFQPPAPDHPAQTPTIFTFAPTGRDEPVNIRTTMINGEPWFVAADVCRALGIYQTTKGQASAIMQRLEDDEFRTLLLLSPTHGGWVRKSAARCSCSPSPASTP